jgi:uncharacterized protein (TIGR02646 family)
VKTIEKKAEPQAFTDWKNLSNNDWQATYDHLSRDEKKAVYKALIEEQGGLCCYCERPLEDNDYHIEHFKPQSDPSVDPLDFSNMLCSCQNQLKKGEPRHCGNLKDDWFDNVLLVSPFDPNCASHFAFTGDGKIKPTSDTDIAASVTIERLGLDIRKLNDLRANAIEPFLDDSLDANDMQKFVIGYLERNTDKHFNEFWTTIHDLFGEYVML